VQRQVNPLVVGFFGQALIGLAIARSIPGFEALPVVRALRERRRAIRALLLMVALGVAADLAANLVGGLGYAIAPLVGEHNLSRQVAVSFHANAFQAFFILLGGAGVAEETLFRLIAVSAIWKLTGRAWIGVLACALLFAAYHFTPLDGSYRLFLQFPISHFLASVLVGCVWGVVYVKRGFGDRDRRTHAAGLAGVRLLRSGDLTASAASIWES
jgi:membrane protease YdiL (CAAX protease family)